MNLYYVQEDLTWLEAPKACRAEFLEDISNLEIKQRWAHTAPQTKVAWDWYLRGWQAGYREER